MPNGDLVCVTNYDLYYCVICRNTSFRAPLINIDAYPVGNVCEMFELIVSANVLPRAHLYHRLINNYRNFQARKLTINFLIR